MLYREIFAVCSQIQTKHIKTQCGQNAELLNFKLAVRIVTMGFRGFLSPSFTAPNCSLLTETDRPEINRITAHRHRCSISL